MFALPPTADNGGQIFAVVALNDLSAAICPTILAISDCSVPLSVGPVEDYDPSNFGNIVRSPNPRLLMLDQWINI